MTNMTEACEHCHFHEADDHPVWRLLMLVVVAAILYQIVTQLDQLEWVAPVTCSWLITGLTPAAALQYDLGAINPGGVGAPLNFAFQGAQGVPGTANRGIGTMEVLAA